MIAIEKAWRQPYMGDIHTALREHLQQNIKNANWPNVHTFDIVQSSWTGKSRMIDELAKECLIIPISLGSSGRYPDLKPCILLVFAFPCNIADYSHTTSACYPPVDSGIFEHLTQGSDGPDQVTRRCGTFIQALLDHMRVVLGRDFLQELASNNFSQLCHSFHERMQEGMQYGKHGSYRTAFYRDALALDAESSWVSHSRRPLACH